MTHGAFFQSLEKGDVGNLYLFVGEEAYVKQSALSRLRERLLPAGLESLNETVLEGALSDEVIEAAETLPMMCEKRLVVVRDFAPLMSGKSKDEAAQSEKMEAYLDRVPDSCCLVFFQRGDVDGRKKLPKTLRKKARVVEFQPLGDAELGKWIRAALKPWNVEIQPRQIEKLVFQAGRSLTILSGEVEKLAAACAGGAILDAQIESLVTPTLEYTIFQMIDALTAQDGKRTFEMLDTLIQTGESRIGILAMLTRQFSMLNAIALMAEKGIKAGQAAAQLGYNAYAASRVAQQARMFTAGALQGAYKACVETDYRIKSGRARDEEALFALVIKLVNLRANPGILP